MKQYTKLDKFIKIINEMKTKGGLSDNMSVDDIAKKHNVSYDDIVKQLIKGKDIETEHTSDEKNAKKIAMDHLVEDPKYYDKLEKMEK